MQPERKLDIVTVRVREHGERLASGSFENVLADHVALERPYLGQPDPCGMKRLRAKVFAICVALNFEYTTSVLSPHY
jgi:hypothetical protein